MEDRFEERGAARGRSGCRYWTPALLVVPCIVTACTKTSVGTDRRPCAADQACLPEFTCHPELELCVPKIPIGCGGTGLYCPTEIETGERCDKPGSFVPCPGADLDCTGGCRTCQQNQEWSACSQCDPFTPPIEICDGLDNDCNGTTDLGAEDCLAFYRDDDGDGYGQTSESRCLCEGAAEYSTTAGGDCDDEPVAGVGIHPNAVEGVADAIDQNCDGIEACYQDLDGDGYGTTTVVLDSDLDCTNDSAATSAFNNDCNDDPATGGLVHPDAVEVVADGIDQDCDHADTCYLDEDGDGHGTSNLALDTDLDCTNDSAATSALNDDCDDDPDSCGSDCVPGRPEICDGQDNDCAGGIDDDASTEPCANQLGVCAGSQTTSCGGSGGWNACDAAAYQSAAQATFGVDYEATSGGLESICDGTDNDCDSMVDDGCGTLVVAAFLGTGITVDGDLGEWTSIGEISLTSTDDYQQLTAPAESDTDLSAHFALRWQPNRLFLAVAVTDEAHHNPYSGTEQWRGDGIQLAFDVARNGGGNYDTTDDWEYGCSLTTGGQDIYRWFAPAGAAAPTYGFGVSRTGNTTNYEMSFAPADLGLGQFGAGDRFGFSLLVNENDNDTFGRRGVLEWSSGIAMAKVPDQFGELQLVP